MGPKKISDDNVYDKPKRGRKSKKELMETLNIQTFIKESVMSKEKDNGLTKECIVDLVIDDNNTLPTNTNTNTNTNTSTTFKSSTPISLIRSNTKISEPIIQDDSGLGNESVAGSDVGSIMDLEDFENSF